MNTNNKSKLCIVIPDGDNGEHKTNTVTDGSIVISEYEIREDCFKDRTPCKVLMYGDKQGNATIKPKLDDCYDNIYNVLKCRLKPITLK